MGQHPFWFLLLLACIGWYSTLTFYIAFRGAFDIRRMLKKLNEENITSDSSKNESGVK